MPAIVLLRGARSSSIFSIAARSYHVGRASSVHTAIARGIRKSNGIGLRGKSKPADGDARVKYVERTGVTPYSPQGKTRPPRPWEGRGNVAARGENGAGGDSRPSGRDRLSTLSNRESIRGRSARSDEKSDRSSFDRFPAREERPSGRDRPYRSSPPPREGGFPRPAGSAGFGQKPVRREVDRSSNTASQYPSLRGSERSGYSKRQEFGERPQEFRAPQKEYHNSGSRKEFGDEAALRSTRRDSDTSPPKFSMQRREPRDDDSTQRPATPLFDRNIPLSIPYTTPASEFLYGTSVVEAALSSRRTPRRKLYKLYIYTGENRENPQQDTTMERLAKNEGVEVVKVNGEWIRLLDKMSTGRPHNGYILEASPLPRLPVKSLGEVSESGIRPGFEVVLDHQSREEAVVNGTETFIPRQGLKSRRHPLVLYLDGITDPGNLGGIIRTASFLGVSAVGISSRNSAQFTPVVLKASAGASENVTIFSVNKPAGFVVDSKAAGWKVFAAVAPQKKRDPDMPASIATDMLADPLSEAPCILMLGSEGEGLRWNLRSKADSDLYIRGSGSSHNVDSLNVSVAAGVLCTAFLNPRKPSKVKVEEAKGTQEANDVHVDEASSSGTSEGGNESKTETGEESQATEVSSNALF